MTEDLGRLVHEAEEALAAASTDEAVRQVEARYLGRKGALTALMQRLGALPSAERPAFGKAVNAAKGELEAAAKRRFAELREAALAAEFARRVDVTVPGRRRRVGHIHPITRATRDASAIFGELGFEVAEGPQIETDFNNFEALNIPKDHPARDMQDTFYVEGGHDLLLRTHTSPVQVRTMRSRRPPVRIIAPGVVYRRDDDPTHSPMFHQIEGLLVDARVSLAELKGVLLHFVHRFFGPDLGVRLRPSYFPFTEPSAEVDMQCVFCRGAGCRTCKQTGWLEIAGCGMVSPAVFEAVGYDPEAVTGFAFGMGIERIAMLRHGVSDIRLFYESDVRFLGQFR
ncbi:MAG: phenylalanine--tRNA ligase subunit alpha [Myxococcota bacterium]